MPPSALKRPRGTSLEDWVDGLPMVFLSNTSLTVDVARAAQKGLLRRLGPRLYTSDTQSTPEAVVRGNALAIASLRFPNAVLSHRSALELAPHEGYLFLTGSHEKTDKLPGLTLRLIKGAPALPGDTKLMDLHQASQARAFLENLKRTRRSGGVSRVLSQGQIERRLIHILHTEGEEALNAIRDRARDLATPLEMSDAFARLDSILGTLLATNDAVLDTPNHARLLTPHDAHRVSLFEILADELRANWHDTSRPSPGFLLEERQNLAFLDAYFSNFIEGTDFLIEEAMDVVFEGLIPDNRPDDAHDVQGSFELLVDAREMGVSASYLDSAEDFEQLLCRRHTTIMTSRANMLPGQFKNIANQAGNTHFVEPEQVQATLAAGWHTLKSLETPFQRAVFVMFLVAEVHPFRDGNGRLARAMMNAELTAFEQTRIIIVTAYRPDYLGALRRLSRKDDPVPFVRMLDRAQELVSRLSFSDIEQLVKTLDSCNAFDDSGLKVMRLPPLQDDQ